MSFAVTDLQKNDRVVKFFGQWMLEEAWWMC